MESKSDGLSLLQLSAVQELANIGLGRAATALSDMTGSPFNMGIPQVSESGLESLPLLLGEDAELFAAVYTPFSGPFNGHLAFLFDWGSICSLCEILAGSRPETPADFDELHASVLMEVGNILNSSFLNALSEMTDLTISIFPPHASISDSVSILSSLAVQAEMEGAMALSVDTALTSMSESHLTGSFLLIPGDTGLSPLFACLGIGDAA